MDYIALKNLIVTHATWPSVTDADLVTWCNEEAITKDHATLSAGTVLSTILSYTAEWTPISDANKQLVRDILYTYSGSNIYACWFWTRALNDVEIRSFSDDPYQFLIPA